MKFWLLIALFDYNGEFVGKAWQGPYINQPACVQAQKMVKLSEGEPVKMLRTRCMSDDVKTGKKADQGPYILRD